MITENIIINDNYSWIDIEHPFKADFDFLKNEFKLPSLLVQDCLKPEHLPKYEKTENGHFILTRAFDPTSTEEDITVQSLTNKLAFFITDDRLITIHNERLHFLSKFAELKKNYFPLSAPSLAHEIFRSIILTYEEPITKIQSQYEEFENNVLSKKDEPLSNTRVYQFRRQLFVIKGMLKLTQNSLHQCREFWSENLSLQQDLKENIDHLYFRLDDISHNFDQLFALYISINDQRNNEVMKILTVFSSIMLPLTFIASFYGMNFDHIPGLHSTTGLVGVAVMMVTLTFSIIWYFNRKRWFNPSL